VTDHKPPGISADEKTTLAGFLNYLRDAIAAKVADVPESQVREPGVASGTNLLGLIRHLTGPAPSMRWLLTHMIEETGRHTGHADILREQIDGVTGR
jgi:hypothetical protein